MNLSAKVPKKNWAVFQNVVQSSAATTFGHPSRKHQNWYVFSGITSISFYCRQIIFSVEYDAEFVLKCAAEILKIGYN